MVINFINKNFNTRDNCIKALMSFRDMQQHNLADLKLIDVFDKWADMKLPMLQMTLSTLYLLIEDGKIVDALEYYKEQVLGYDLFDNRTTETIKFRI